MMYAYIYIYFVLTVFGLAIGSFCNVVIHRLPKGDFPGKARSACPECTHTLSVADLIPIFGYVRNKGKCRYCGARINPRYPLVEAAVAVFAALCFLRFGLDIRTAFTFACCAVLICITLIDMETMTIPDSFHIIFALLGVWACFINGLMPVERAIGLFAVSLPMFLIAFAVKGAFGGGDIKLMAVCGFLLGWKGILLAFFAALILGGSAAVYLLIFKRSGRGSKMPFGPYLCAGIATALFYGEEIINFYLSLYAF